MGVLVQITEMYAQNLIQGLGYLEQFILGPEFDCFWAQKSNIVSS